MKKYILLAVFVLMSIVASAQSPHSVTLSWTQSTTINVTSNNVYESLVSASGPWTKVFTSVSPMITYTDNSVSGGKTYYYAVTALVDTSESGYSNSVIAAVPTNPFAPTGLTLTSVK